MVQDIAVVASAMSGQRSCRRPWLTPAIACQAGAEFRDDLNRPAECEGATDGWGSRSTKRAGRPHVQLNVSDSFATTMGQIAGGGPVATNCTSA